MASTAVSPRANQPVVSGRSAPSGYGSPRPSSAATRPRSGGRTQQGAPARVPDRDVRLPGERGLPPVSSSRGSRPGGLSAKRRPGPARGIGGGPSISDTNYGAVIIAEFVGVILVIALAPVAKGEPQSGVSPYGGGDMVKLAGATILYVILGFVAMGGRGAARLAAWFGGLTLIATGLAEGTVLAKEVGLFTGNLLAASGGTPSGGSSLAAGEAAAGGPAAEGGGQSVVGIEGTGTGPGSGKLATL
jgi:hypothetical protein